MIIKPISKLVQELDAKSITVIGNPCADGLGVDALRLFYDGLAGAEGDLVIVPGDVSPRGRDPFYSSVGLFIDHVSPAPVHVMRGNHDNDEFEKHFGHSNRAILSEHFILIMLDNSRMAFSREALDFLRETLARVDGPNIIVSFHHPPPNRLSGNTLSAEAWKEFEDAVGVWRSRITLMVCGHEHCYYEDDIDGIRLVVTGCGGAKLGRLTRVKEPRHHVVEIAIDDEGCAQVSRREVHGVGTSRSEDAIHLLTGIYHATARHHVDMVLRAEDALHEGMPHLALMYKALAASFFGQARMLHRLATADRVRGDTVRFSRDLPPAGYSEGEMLERLERNNDVVAVRAVKTVSRTELGLKAILSSSRNHVEKAKRDLEWTRYFICKSCSAVYPGEEPPEYCRECGAPVNSFGEIA